MSVVRPLALVIEDDVPSGEALSFILSDWGAEVVLGHDGAAAESAIAGRLGDVRWIITDFHLGDGPDGVSVVRQLTRSAPQARVLVLSGSFHGRAHQAAMEWGYGVMQKPARAASIVAWLEGG
jgi:DNA-binding response OmpR family regulator